MPREPSCSHDDADRSHLEHPPSAAAERLSASPEGGGSDSNSKNDNLLTRNHKTASTSSKRVVLKHRKSTARIVSLQSLCINFLLSDLRNRLYGWRFFDEECQEMTNFCKLYRKRVPPHVRRLMQVNLVDFNFHYTDLC